MKQTQKRIKNFSKQDDMRGFRIIITSVLGILCGVFSYYGINTALSVHDLPFEIYIMIFFPTMVTLSCLLVGIFVEEDARPEAEYIK